MDKLARATLANMAAGKAIHEQGGFYAARMALLKLHGGESESVTVVTSAEALKKQSDRHAARMALLKFASQPDKEQENKKDV
ncbi:MAG: hypothetical protein P4N60_19785 [Verrucomicrobiae bacterium]|nr:hypothetical protein [Verrucomicrobiae bacterium]